MVFLQHFQNLQTLRLRLNSKWICYVEEVLSQTLAYVCGIKSLRLNVTSAQCPTIVMKDIVKCSQLEELTIEFEWEDGNPDDDVRNLPLFDEHRQISSCSKLRNVTLSKYLIKTNNLIVYYVSYLIDCKNSIIIE